VSATYDSPVHHCHHYSLECHRTCTFPVCTAWDRNTWTVLLSRWWVDNPPHLGYQSNHCLHHKPKTGECSVLTGDMWTAMEIIILFCINHGIPTAGGGGRCQTAALSPKPPTPKSEKHRFCRYYEYQKFYMIFPSATEVCWWLVHYNFEEQINKIKKKTRG
jgi:hypothetical protein